MKIIHIIVGSQQAKVLAEAFEIDENNSEESVLCFNDYLNIGKLKTEDSTFSEGRTQIQLNVNINSKLKDINDLEELMKLSTAISNGEEIQIWFWTAQSPEERCAYYFLLHFLKKHADKISIVNIANLPFIDDAGKLFYPNVIADLPAKEIIKCRKLVRTISPSEWEIDKEEWRIMVEQNAEIRLNDGVKGLKSAELNFLDHELDVKDGKIASKQMNALKDKYKMHLSGNEFLKWRVNELLLTGSESSAPAINQ